MALLWALAVLSLLPLLDAQSPKCANLMTAAPISNTTMDWVSARLPEHRRQLLPSLGFPLPS